MSSCGSSIYDAIGGKAALEVAVDRFYDRVALDPLLAPFFAGMDVEQIKAHQVAFLGQAIGGPAVYSGASMQRAHEHLRIEQRHFHAVAAHLVRTLEELAVPEPIIATIIESLEPVQAKIVNTPTVTPTGAD